jgi:hypothetical protein
MGLVRHMSLVEWSWFEERFAGLTVPSPISMDPDPDADFNDLDPARCDDDFARFAAQCDISRRISAGAELDQLAAATRQPMTLRWITVHMIADLLREAIDGAVGE